MTETTESKYKFEFDSPSQMVETLSAEIPRLESNIDNQRVAKKVVRKFDQFAEALAEFDDTLAKPSIGVVENLREQAQYEIDPRAVEAADRLKTIIQVADSGIPFSGFDVDDARKVLTAWKDALAAAKAKRSGPKSEVRGIGTAIRASCKCGDFEAVSNQGDWSSMRYRIKEHAKVCETANPGLADSLTNDLDRVRKSIVELRQPTTTGGVTVTLDEPEPF